MQPKNKKNTIAERLKQRGAIFASADLPRVIEIDLHKLRANPDQSRMLFKESSLRELAESIKQHGLIQPISIASDPDDTHNENYIIVAGERRYRAHQLLNLTTIPAIVTSGNPAEIAVIENLQRENLHPLEEAYALSNLMQKHGYTQEVVGQVIGKARNTVTSLLRLTTLPQQIQDECPMSDISKSALIELARIENTEEQLALWEEMKKGNYKTVRAARASKKEVPDPQKQIALGEPVLKAGFGFIRQLRKITSGKIPAEDEFITKLHTIRDQIDEILGQVNDHTPSTEPKSQKEK